MSPSPLGERGVEPQGFSPVHRGALQVAELLVGLFMSSASSSGGGGTALGFGVIESTDENFAASFATAQTSSYRVTTHKPSNSLL